MIDDQKTLEQLTAHSLIKMAKITTDQFFFEYIILVSRRLENNLNIIAFLRKLNGHPVQCSELKTEIKLSAKKIRNVSRRLHAMPTDPESIILLDLEVSTLLRPDIEVTERRNPKPLPNGNNNKEHLEKKIEELTNIVEVLKLQLEIKL